jgi:DNA-binding beta-propeller fold protein YncE
MKRFLWLGGMAYLCLLWTGCGDTFRPIIIPNPPTFPDPRAAHTVVAISDNGSISRGSVLVVDVSGDSEVSIANVGATPVHAVQQSANQVLVLNQATTTNLNASLTKLIFSGVTISANPNVISLPPNSAPDFVAVAPSDTAVYVSLPNYIPDPNPPATVVPSVGVVNTTSNTMVATIPVGGHPFALVVTPDKSKLYVACDPQAPGACSLSAFNTLDRSPRAISGTLGSAPIWLAARSDSQRVYVLEADGTLASLDTTSTPGPDTLTESAISVPGATTMLYDGHLNRLYIPGGSQMAIVDVAPSQPQLLQTISIPSFSLMNFPPVTAVATAVTVLPDGSRAYVASYPSSIGGVLPSQFDISSVSGNGTTATYAYSLTAGHELTSGMAITVTGTEAGFDGIFIIGGVVRGTSACPGTCFQAPNPTSTNGNPDAVSGTGTGSNVFPQVTVVNTSSNTIRTTVGIAGFPDATDPSSAYFVPTCATTRFRFTMASGGDSSRAYLAACDGGGVNVIDTSTDTFLANLPAPFSGRPAIPPSVQQPPQNPVFLIAGP